MRFGYAILYVPDVPASLDFYERAFGQRRRFLHESGQYAELETGGTALAFAALDLAASNLPDEFVPAAAGESAPSFEVCFVTDDVSGAFSRAVKQGAEPVTTPHSKPWGQDVAYVRDLDGTLVEIASPAS